MPTYQAPANLDHLPIVLRTLYKGNHPDRLNFITLLERLSEGHLKSAPSKVRDQLFMNNSVFELELTESQYKKYWFLRLSYERSSMVKLLHQHLKITKTNQLTFDVRLYYLNKFYQFVQKNISDDDLQGLMETGDECWLTKESLLKKIHELIKQLIYNNQDRFNQLVYATPDLLELRKGTKELPQKYREARKNRWASWQSKEREPMLALIQLIHKSFYYFYPAYESKEIPLFQELESNARRGLILSFLLDIDNRRTIFNPPQGWWFTNGSELSKAGLSILNLKDLSQLNADQKINLLQACVDHIEKIENDLGYLKIAQEIWQHKGHSDLNAELKKFKEKVYKIKKIEEERKLTPSISETVVTKGTSLATQSGVSYFCQEKLLAVGTGIATAVGGPIIGAAVFISGKLCLTGLAPFIEKKLLTLATANLYTFVLDRLGQTVGSKVAEQVFKFSPTKEGLMTLIKKMSAEDQKAFKRWVNTLLELPDDIVSQKEKQQIRNVLNLEAGSKLKFFQSKHSHPEHVYINDEPQENLSKSLNIRLHT